MSRFDGYDNYDGDGISPSLWDVMIRRSMAGRKGQRWLARTLEVLEALPRKELIADHVATPIVGTEEDEDGCFIPVDCDVCVIGAVLRVDGQFKDLQEFLDARLPYTGYRIGDEWETPDAEEVADFTNKRLGISRVMVSHMQFVNDEILAGAEPAERYNRMVAWIKSNIGVTEWRQIVMRPETSERTPA